MKRLLFLLIIPVLALAACQKELTFETSGAGTGGGGTNPDTNYFVKFKLNGTAFDYRIGVTAVKASFPAPLNVKTLTVQGRPGNAIQPAIGVDVRDAVDIVANRTYTETLVNGTFSSLLYTNATGDIFSTAFATSASGFECRFSEVTATYVKGTFKGKTESLTGTVMDITEGSFYAKIP
jgi:hypothetical protein